MRNYLARIDELLANQRKKLIGDRDEKVLGEEKSESFPEEDNIGLHGGFTLRNESESSIKVSGSGGTMINNQKEGILIGEVPNDKNNTEYIIPPKHKIEPYYYHKLIKKSNDKSEKRTEFVARVINIETNEIIIKEIRLFDIDGIFILPGQKFYSPKGDLTSDASTINKKVGHIQFSSYVTWSYYDPKKFDDIVIREFFEVLYVEKDGENSPYIWYANPKK